MPLPTGPNGEVNGADILVQLEVPDASGLYQTIGSQRGATYTENTAKIDMSSKNSRLEYVNPGRYTSTVHLEHLYIPTASGLSRLKDAMRNGKYVRLRRFEQGATLEGCQAIVTTLGQTAPDQEASVITADFAVNGAWA